jgi:hypothetical protein
LNGDDVVDFADIHYWVSDLANTWIGDSNIDLEFNSNDLVTVFQSSKYETGQAATWSSGDWNGDGLFGSSDLVSAFQDGGYEKGPRIAGHVVPEPSCGLAIVVGLLCLVVRHR